MTSRDVLRRAAALLEEHGIETARFDAELLLAHALGCSRTELYAAGDGLAEEAVGRFQSLVARRARREPLAYILGEWGFRRLTLRVDPRALIPRPETEVLVGRCLALLEGRERPRVLDVGVGSGAIALAIADEHPGARVTGVDRSAGALALARENAARTGLAVDLLPGSFEAADGDWELVVSNPPYVAEAEYAALQPEIRNWEPRDALVGEGLHERLARHVRSGWLVLECGDGQARDVAVALSRLGYADVAISPDLTGRERVVEGRRG